MSIIIWAIILCIICCLLSLSISISIWMNAAYDLKKKRMCNTSKKISVVYCPLNQELVASYIFNDEDDLYYSKNFVTNFNKKYDENKISFLDYFNNYYSGVTPPPETGVNYMIYCNSDMSLCGLTKNVDINIAEDIIYKSIYKEKLYFYCDINFIVNISQKRFDTIQDFLSECSKYSKRIEKCENISNDEEKQKLMKSCIFFGDNFFMDSKTVIKTLSTTILGGLNNNILNEYLNILKTKMEVNKAMTTFELFMYYAIKLKLENVQYIILKTK
jgi:hypothetical protein